ncbi:hypothetical protein N7E81_14645 [Reichenbachiella carrageenanivorans]|uniref:HEAT repeat-containing protein n=1 Tax=Reichenbachiella carrageenanivorans TaxID=2979869 RepID=A0ABY6CXF2_9BACT|nr:hypothetical protein [Reichenbachiella carrageenanivorans]UXX78597.1 hypothetical protein N7E81_14645 [Reichenbachiella carrageenanivorans]
MDLKKQLALVHSKENARLIADHIASDEDRFAELMQLFFYPEYRVSQRAAHAVSHCVDAYPHLLLPYIGPMIEYLQSNPEVAIRRNTVRLLQSQEIPEAFQGILLEKCFEYLQQAHETAAVKAFSMTIIHRFTKQYPELKPELKLVIEDVLLHATPGVMNRGKKILKDLN